MRLNWTTTVRPPFHAPRRFAFVSIRSLSSPPPPAISPSEPRFAPLQPITHTMPLPEINSGFDLMHAGKSIRSVVTY